MSELDFGSPFWGLIFLLVSVMLVGASMKCHLNIFNAFNGSVQCEKAVVRTSARGCLGLRCHLLKAHLWCNPLSVVQ